MAEKDNENPLSFDIQDTIEGIGDQQLLSDLLNSETATGDPDEVVPIIKEVEPSALPKKKEVKAGKEIVPKVEGEEAAPQDIISNFLSDNEEDDNNEENKPPSVSNQVDETSPTDDKPSVFNSLSKELLKLGVFTTDEGEQEEEITTPEGFLERFKEEKKKGAIEVVNNFIGQFGEDYQAAFDAIFVKGVNPKDYFGVYNNIVDFTNLDLTVEENQITVIRQALTNQGLDPEDVTTEIERLKNYGDLETVSAKHHKVLVRKQAQKLSEIEAQAERDLQQKAAIKNQYVQNVTNVLQEKLKTKEFDGIPINPKLANELQDFLLVDKYQLKSGETLTDFDRTILDLKRPENHATKVKIALLLKILEKDPTLSTIQRTAVSKKSEEMFGDLARQVVKTKTLSESNQQPKSWFQ